MRVLSLFSGGGLGDYGLTLAGMDIVGQVEIDEYCQKVLKLRWPDVPKWKDIKHVTGKEIIERCGTIDLISGGFPCQAVSQAGKRKGKDDARWLWPEYFRLICEIKPRWVLGENVKGLLSIDNGRFFGGILRDLASLGYDVEWDCIPASAVGAPHQRDRVWIIANSEGKRWRPVVQNQQEGCEGIDFKSRDAFWRHCVDLHLDLEPDFSEPGERINRNDDGLAEEVDRLKLLGNGQVVQVVQWIGKRIMENK